jgi:hypothetical protein
MLSLLNRYILKGRNFCKSIVLHSNEATKMRVLKVFGIKEPPVPVFENLKRTAGFYGRSHKELAVQGRFFDGQSRFHLLDIYSPGFYGRSHKELAVQGRFFDGQSRFHLLDIYSPALSLKKTEPPNLGMHYAPPVFLTLANQVSSQE